jgi:hypothetical protein
MNSLVLVKSKPAPDFDDHMHHDQHETKTVSKCNLRSNAEGHPRFEACWVEEFREAVRTAKTQGD